MSIADALFSEQTSTSLYEKVGNKDDKHILPLTRARPTYCAVPNPNPNPNQDGAEDGQPEIVVQVRKRNGKLQLFLDGYLSE